jgi:electron transfer flavoprotein alpha subunit
VIAVVPVRGGHLPLGADEAVAEAGGRVLLVGEGTADAARALIAAATDVAVAEVGAYAPAAWAAALAAEVVDDDVVLLPASPDGRDLAPRLAATLRRPLLAGAVLVAPDRVVLARRGGLVAEEHRVDGPVVTTLLPGVRGVEPGLGGTGATTGRRPAPPRPVGLVLDPAAAADPEVLEVTPADPATMDLAEAPRILAGGAGLAGGVGDGAGAAAFALLADVAAALGASMGATRVATDAGWAPFERQIGTTGVAVDPRLYVALGISGAVQHVGGLGDPEHVVAVNLDPSAPMMTMADLAIVTDAGALLRALAARLGVAAPAPAPAATTATGESAGG